MGLDMDMDKIRFKLLDVADPNIDYTMEDFNKEFDGQFNNYFGDKTEEDNSMKIEFNFVNKSTNQDPEYATVGSSGFDFRADLSDDVEIESGSVAIIPTGLYFETPPNFEIQVRPRSGLAVKNGVTVLNTPGTVDADYRGEVKVILINHGKETFTVKHGDRIAQGVIATVISKNIVNLKKIEEITTETERGSGGFGSTGKA